MSSIPRLVLLGGCRVAMLWPKGAVSVMTQWYMPASDNCVSEKYRRPLREMNWYVFISGRTKFTPGPLNHWTLAAGTILIKYFFFNGMPYPANRMDEVLTYTKYARAHTYHYQMRLSSSFTIIQIINTISTTHTHTCARTHTQCEGKLSSRRKTPRSSL